MDRLPPLILLAALVPASACDDSATPRAPLRRVDAVVATKSQVEPLAAFCDAHATSAASATPFRYPALAGVAPAPAAGRWRWINVWATWCKPCIAELPLILAWQRQWREAGSTVDVVPLSVDDSEAPVAAFRRSHPELPPGPRVATPDSLTPWLVALGLDDGASVPIHLFVDPAGGVRCVRAGGIAEHHRQTVEALLRGSGADAGQ